MGGRPLPNSAFGRSTYCAPSGSAAEDVVDPFNGRSARSRSAVASPPYICQAANQVDRGPSDFSARATAPQGRGCSPAGNGPEDTLEGIRGEILRLRRELRSQQREAQSNEAIFRRFNTLELSLLNAASLAELLGRCVHSTREVLALDEVTVDLHDPEREVRNLLAGNVPSPDLPAGVRFSDDPMRKAPVSGRLEGPWLGPYRAEHARLFSGTSRLGSVALLPLTEQGRQFGSLNLASRDPVRYTRGHASDFHVRLASVASMCLQNAINRERLVASGHTDPLTQWYNRRYLAERLPQEVARAIRYGEPLCCLLLDVDHFKHVNDRYGHLTGDLVLSETAARIKRQVRSSDLTVRYGGEELLVLLIGATGEEADRVAERVRERVAATPFRTGDGRLLWVTLSGGISELPTGGRSCDPAAMGADLLHSADLALYRAKADGRNRIVRSGRG